MKYLLLILLLTGCETVVYRDGKPVLRTYSDIRGLRFHSGDTSLEAASLVNSKPTQAAFDGVAKDLTAAGAAGSLFLPR